MKKTLTMLGALAMGLSLTACGPTYPANGAHDGAYNDGAYNQDAMMNYYFYRMDANGDGWISRSEHEAFASGMFTRIDNNRDNYLTYREVADFHRGEWADWHDNYSTRTGAYYEGDKYYPYGKGSPTRTPNEPYKANRGMTDRSYKDYETRDHNMDHNDPYYRDSRY